MAYIALQQNRNCLGFHFRFFEIERFICIPNSELITVTEFAHILFCCKINILSVNNKNKIKIILARKNICVIYCSTLKFFLDIRDIFFHLSIGSFSELENSQYTQFDRVTWVEGWADMCSAFIPSSVISTNSPLCYFFLHCVSLDVHRHSIHLYPAIRPC